MTLSGATTLGQSEPGVIWFYGTSTIVGYLIPNHFYTYKQFYFKQFSLV